MITVDNLVKRYGEVRALNGISFNVEKGEILGFLGPNGAGKTTAMRIITGFIHPSSGSVNVAGYNVDDSPIEVKRKIGYLPENQLLYNDMKVDEFLSFAASIKRVPRKKRNKRIEQVKHITGIEDVSQRLIGKLSKGYRQRVGLAQAFIHEPEILILDEPTMGLDPKQIIEVRNLIKNFSGTHTVILSTHILPEASMTCDRVVIINKGNIVGIDTPELLSKRLKGTSTIFLMIDKCDAEQPAELIKNLSGVLSVERADFKEELSSPKQDRRSSVQSFIIECETGREIRHQVSRFVVEKGWELLEIRTMMMSLEDVFLKLTTEEKEVS